MKADEEILELETDKVNQVLYAPASGSIQLKVKTGDVVQVGQVIGFVDESGFGVEEKPAPVMKKEEKRVAGPP